MLHKCANPDCSSLFRRMTQGKLFQVETHSPHPLRFEAATVRRREKPSRRVEYYWLCDACSCYLTLVSERGRGMMTVPLPNPAAKKPASAALTPVGLASPQARTGSGRIQQ
jgi:hypothetical protein